MTRPIIKEPVWTPEIPFYFYTGGVAGAGAALAYGAGLRGEDVLARRAWAVALGGAIASPALLISDLGRPERFFNMLRVFKVTSPMSVGSWILAGAGTTIGVATVDAWTGRLRRPAAVARPLAAALGLPLSTYTAALIANTAVPAWHEVRRELPFLFGASAVASAGAAVVLVTPSRHARPARRMALAGALAEVALTVVTERRAGRVADAYTNEPSGKAAKALGLGGAALLATGRARAGAALVSLGALATRWSVFRAGSTSAADPSHTVATHRAAIARGDVRPAARSGTPARRAAG